MANILVVDDEPDVVNALERALRLEGHNVRTAPNAAEALALAKDHQFDIVVLDYIMPSMSGIELLNRIRDVYPTIRSIIVSGKIDAQVTEETIAAELRDSIEADAYLHKPLDNEKFLLAVEQLLRHDDQRDWKDVAERHLKAKKPSSTVKGAEKGLGRHKKTRRP